MLSGERAEKARVRSRAWREANKERANHKARLWQLENPERRREHARAAARKKLGLPEPTRPCPETCELCGGPPGKKSLCLDHCHATGKFRGWLCGNCNRVLGLFKDSPKLFRAAADYLERF